MKRHMRLQTNTRPPIPRRGFTLLELMIVVAIIALLVGVVAPRYFGQLEKSERSTAKTQLHAFARAMDNFRVDTGKYPTQNEGLGALTTRPNANQKWNGPYLQGSVPKDPWGNDYGYEVRRDRNKTIHLIRSKGADGRLGGEGADEDVTLMIEG